MSDLEVSPSLQAGKKANRLHELYASMQKQLAANLDAARNANKNANAKGDESELTWLKLFEDHLPHRYRSVKGIVIDCDGCESDAIDIVIYDRHYTPIIYNQHGYPYIPAESVYAVLEAKQEFDKELIEYAGAKAESVRKLTWTSGKITAITGNHEPRKPFRVLAGIVAYESAWKEPFGESFRKAVANLNELQQLDLGIAAAHGCFELLNAEKKELKAYPAERALAAFLIRLLARLQALGTVPAIDYDIYGRLLD